MMIGFHRRPVVESPNRQARVRDEEVNIRIYTVKDTGRLGSN